MSSATSADSNLNSSGSPANVAQTAEGANEASRTSSSTGSPSVRVCYLFLDIDGVLNRIEDDDEFASSSSSSSAFESDEADEHSKKKKKKKKHKKKKKKEKAKKEKEKQSKQQEQGSAPKRSSVDISFLPCVPSLDRIQNLLQQLQLEASIDAQLLRHLCHCVHSYTCSGDMTSTPASSSKPTVNSTAVSRPVQIVLTSTWRLQPTSLAALTQLLQELSLVAITDHTTVTPSSSPTPTQAASYMKTSCSTSLPLLVTPDLKGWATRLEEIYAFFQQIQPKQSCDEFIIVDDMNLYPTLPRLSPISDDVLGNLSSLSVTSHVDELAYVCYHRTIKLDGARGLDAAAVQQVIRSMFIPNASVSLHEFLSKVKSYQLPMPP